MAWTGIARREHSREGLRYPSDMTDGEWALAIGTVRNFVREAIGWNGRDHRYGDRQGHVGPVACETWLKRQGRVSRIHRKKPKGKPMPERTAKANAAKSRVRARVEHVFAHQKDQMGLFIRTVGIARAETKITLANLAYNMNPLIFHERRMTMA